MTQRLADWTRHPALYVSNVFSDPMVNKINFLFGALPVTPVGLQRVAEVIRSGRVPVRLMDRGELRSGVRAQYVFSRGGPGELQVRRNENLFDLNYRGTIVHEGVHALFHLSGRTVPRLVNEGAAFLAQTVYILQYAYDFFSPVERENLASGYWDEYQAEGSPAPPPANNTGTWDPRALRGFPDGPAPSEAVKRELLSLALDRRFDLWRGSGAMLRPSDYEPLLQKLAEVPIYGEQQRQTSSGRRRD